MERLFHIGWRRTRFRVACRDSNVRTGRIFLKLRPIFFIAAAIAVALAVTGILSTVTKAGTLGTESGDWAYPNGPTFDATLGSQTVTGTLGPTPDDGQDPFNVNIPSALAVTSVSYSGPSGPHNLVGCGLTGTSNLNQTFSSNNSGCQLSWFINTDFAVSSSAWTVTIVTAAVPTATPVAPTPTNTPVPPPPPPTPTNTPIPPTPTNTPVPPTPTNTPIPPTPTNTPIPPTPTPVPDTTPPTVTVPADITVLATGLDGAVVNFSASATDAVGVTSFGCSPVPGSTFAVGTTTVDCSASDAAGNVGSASFNVNVVVDSSSIGTLDDEIESLGLPNGVTNSLQGPLNQATRLLEDSNPNNDGAVCDKLDSFLEHVQDRLDDGSLTAQQAADLTAFATAIQSAIGC